MRRIISVTVISTVMLFTINSLAAPANPYKGQQGWGQGRGCCQSYNCPAWGNSSGSFLSGLPYSDRQEYHQLITADNFDKSKFEAFFEKHGMKNRDQLLEWSYQHYEWFHQLP